MSSSAEHQTGDDPKLIVFLAALHEPIGIPRGSIYSFDEGREAALGEVNLHNPFVQVAPNLSPAPGSDAQQLFVSLKFWQMRSGRAAIREQMEMVDKVLHDLTGRNAPTKNERQSAALEGFVTVVEMVTYLEVDREDAVSEAFDRCLARLGVVTGAYSTATHQGLPPVTRERLSSFILFVLRSLEQPYSWTGPSVLMTHYNDAIREAPRELDEETSRVMMDLVRGEIVRNPVRPYLELTEESLRTANREGDYRSAVINLQSADEVLIDSLLAGMLWEEQVTAEEAAQILNRPLKTKLASEFHPRLGGSWQPDVRGGAVGDWYATVPALRGRCAHGGYQPTRDELGGAQQAHKTLVTFATERLKARQKRFPLTAAMHTRSAKPVDNLNEKLREFVRWRDEVTNRRLLA